jgi:integrase
MPKGKRVRSVPMMSEVIATLATLKEREHFTEDGDLVFCSALGAFLDHFELRKNYYAALERAGLRLIRFHDLRHAFGSAAITKLDPYAVQSHMGTSITRPRSATCTTSPGARTPPRWRKRLARRSTQATVRRRP